MNGNNEAIVHVVETPGINLIVSKCLSFSVMSCFCSLGVSLVSRDGLQLDYFSLRLGQFLVSKFKIVVK